MKVIKPSFSDKAVSNENITLIENNEIINNENKICEIFNDFFSNIVSNFNISETEYSSKTVEGTDDPVSIAIKRYENHPRIIKIKNTFSNVNTCSFQHVSREEIHKEIINLNPTKASQDSDLLIKIITENSDILCAVIYNDFNNNLINNGNFPNSLKAANITPVFKKDSLTEKSNYRPVSIPPNLSKIYERLIYNELSKYLEHFLSKFQCGFRKGFNAPDC